MNALHLVEAPTLHSVASICYESPSGASLAQFLMVTLSSFARLQPGYGEGFISFIIPEHSRSCVV